MVRALRHYLSTPYNLGSPPQPSTGKSEPTGMRQWRGGVHVRACGARGAFIEFDELMRIRSMLYRRVDHLPAAFRFDISGVFVDSLNG